MKSSDHREGKKMKTRFLMAFVLSLSIGYAFNLPYAVSAATLYDNFNKTTIDSTKWDSSEFVREIQDIKEGKLVNRKLVSKVTAYGETIRNWVDFKNPESINYIEADVVVNAIGDKYKDADNYNIPRARLIGYFYNDGAATGPGSRWGEVQGVVNIRKYKGRLEAHWSITRYDNDAGDSWTTVDEGVFPVAISLKKTYKVSILFEPTKKTFTFSVTAPKGKTTVTLTASRTTTDTINPSNVPWKAIGTQVWFTPTATSLTGSISATFDNVKAGSDAGSTPVVDDFSSAELDPSLWNTYEFVREVSKGAFRSASRGVNGGVRNSLEFKNPQKVKDLQANVTLVSYENPNGSNTRARLGAYFYNENGPPANGYEGEVWAEVAIGGEGKDPVAFWYVWRNDSYEQNVEGEELGRGELGSVMPGTPYQLFIGWDGQKITFRCNEATADYIIGTEVYPPNHPAKSLATRISAPSSPDYQAFISATFDDVYINGTGIPIDGSWLVDLTGVVKGGAIFDCFAGTFSGYGVSMDTVGANLFNIWGDYTVDSAGIITGTFTVDDSEGGANSGTLTGKIDSKITILSLTAVTEEEDGIVKVKLAGVPLPPVPEIPENWTVKVSGSAQGILDSFTISPYYDEDESKLYPRIFTFSGTTSGDDVEVTGGFFLGQKNKVYGGYELNGVEYEEGLLSGTITLLPSAKFNFTATRGSEFGKRRIYTLTGTKKP